MQLGRTNWCRWRENRTSLWFITGLLEKKQQQLGKRNERIEEIVTEESDKIPLPVREDNKEKLTELEKELIQLESTLSTLFTMS